MTNSIILHAVRSDRFNRKVKVSVSAPKTLSSNDANFATMLTGKLLLLERVVR